MARRSQLKLANQGARLLKSKREALLKELLSLVEPLTENHQKLARALQQAGRSMTYAEALDGTAYLRSLALAAGAKRTVDVEEERFWGVRLPDIQAGEKHEGSQAAASGMTTRSVEATRDMSELLDALLRLAPLQVRMTLLGEEVKKTARRVNALDQVLVPRLQKDIKGISQALEEMEREDAFRLRRIKQKREGKEP